MKGALDLGVYHVLHKPIEMHDLESLLRGSLRGRLLASLAFPRHQELTLGRITPSRRRAFDLGAPTDRMQRFREPVHVL